MTRCAQILANRLAYGAALQRARKKADQKAQDAAFSLIQRELLALDAELPHVICDTPFLSALTELFTIHAERQRDDTDTPELERRELAALDRVDVLAGR